jgi:hypothetical protein
MTTTFSCAICRSFHSNIVDHATLSRLDAKPMPANAAPLPERSRLSAAAGR